MMRGLASISRPAFAPGFCRYCGCTDNQACPGGCYWIRPNICSACSGRAGIVCNEVPKPDGPITYRGIDWIDEKGGRS
jgi:hypothetical protein